MGKGKGGRGLRNMSIIGREGGRRVELILLSFCRMFIMMKLGVGDIK